MSTVTDTVEKLKIIPVVTLDKVEDAVPLASALLKGGIHAAEVTFRTESAYESIQAISKAYPNMMVGAGTVLSPAQVDSAVSAGAKFIVSPGFDLETVRHCIQIGIPVFPGCVTASEVQKAISLGLKILKFFPAEQSGGLNTLKALSAPFPQIRWMPTGGINLKNLLSYLSFPKVIACGGSYMVGRADIQAKNWDKITELSRQTLRLIQGTPETPASPSASVFSNSKKTYDIVTLGEILMKLSAFSDKRISDGCAFNACIGGSELNVISGMARMGCKASMISCLPGHDIGKLALHEMHRMGIDSGMISTDKEKDARLGIYYFEGGAAPRKPKVVYDRNHSSIGKLNLNHIPQSVYSDTKIFHTTGITLALEAVRETAVEAIRRFHEGGALISFDINYRANLWDEDTARRVLTEILPQVDILFISEESLRRMFRKTGSLKEIMKNFASEFAIQILATSARKVVSEKEHVWNSTIYSAAKDEYFTDTPYSIHVIDRVGSGDAFDAGVLYGLLAHQSEKKMVEYGNVMAALKCTIPGDLPDLDRDDVEKILELHRTNDKSELIR